MKPMRWPSIRPSVWKWPRVSRAMLRLRPPEAVLSWIAAKAVFGVAACAGLAAVILSASCAMKVPRPIITAAKIIMLRMTHTHCRDRQHAI
jgi:hypothetical protein